MDVLVASASRHGATAEIAQAIAETLERAGHHATVETAEDVAEVGMYDAVILGSAIYMGHWMEPMKALIERTAADLAHRPVWLFSSGPLGDVPMPAPEPADVPALIEQTHSVDHRTFAGKLDRHQLGLGERIVATAVRAPEGDFRPWVEVREWACDIARALAREPVAQAAG